MTPGAVALQEAMRMRPVAATGSTRYTKRALMLGGHFLPKGTMVDVPFYAVWTRTLQRHASCYAGIAQKCQHVMH